MYEQRVAIEDLPFFLGLLDHLAEKGSPVPRTIHDRSGAPFRMIGDKAVALIEFLPGVSVDSPDAAQAQAVGAALAGLHQNAADFAPRRENAMSLPAWRLLYEDCGEARLAGIDQSLPSLFASELDFLAKNWPAHLPRSVIHADLFPDNVLLLDDRVSGLIDFYFACTDITAYDVAVTHAAWCFNSDGSRFDPALSAALLAGYESVRPLSEQERAALPVLARGASMRFLMTRAYDWMNTPADAMVTRKDPMAFARRLEFYSDMGNAGIFDAR